MNKEKEIEKINKHIGELVYDKTQLKKAYNYYHCVRDKDQFAHLEQNYGIGAPTTVGFSPLVKKHIDVLVGEYLELDPDLQITCKDSNTISNIMREKQLKIDQELYSFLTKYLQNSIIQILMESKEPTYDPFIEKELQKIKTDVENDFVSQYEIAAQNILNYIKHSRDIDLKNKMRELFTDILIAGCCYYRTKPSGSKTNLAFEVLNPLDTFIERNPNEFYLNRSPRAVIRKFMTREQILAEFGSELSPEAKSILKKSEPTGRDNGGKFIYVKTGRFDNLVSFPETKGLLGGWEVHPLRNGGVEVEHNMSTYTVYEVEWLEWDKEKERLTRHEGVKIGPEIYICRGESEYITRSVSDPTDCTISVNGLFFSDRNGNPFSLVLSTANLQDQFDVLIYHRESLLASSGTVGDWIDVASLPEFLGQETPDRLLKWIAYKKQGIALYDSSQEGSNIINTTFNGFDDTVKVQAIQAIQVAIDAIEQQVSSITGVFPEKLGGIQERDAVSNVKVGLRYSTLLTKQYFSAMDLMYKEINYDLLNLAKIVYKNGFNGTVILGPRLNKIFTAIPEHYTTTDFDIHIEDSTESYKTREEIKAINIEFIKAGMIEPDMAINVITSKNLTDLKQYMSKALKMKKAENDMNAQLQQQIEQLTQQAKQYEQQIGDFQNQIKQLTSQVQNNNAEKLEIEKKRVRVEEQEANDKRDFNNKQIEVKEKQLQVEVAQITDGNPYNDKIHD